MKHTEIEGLQRPGLRAHLDIPRLDGEIKGIRVLGIKMYQRAASNLHLKALIVDSAGALKFERRGIGLRFLISRLDGTFHLQMSHLVIQVEFAVLNEQVLKCR